MAAKIIIFLGLVALSQAAPPSHGWQQAPAPAWQPAPAPAWQPAPSHGWKEPEAPANYEFNYEVHDEHTGDIKRQQEHAQNGVIKGQYSLYDADGFRRVVTYTADDHNGFVADVQREKIQGHQQPAKQGWKAPQANHGWQAPQQTIIKYVQAPAPSHGWQ
jgi:hypothetical protein